MTLKAKNTPTVVAFCILLYVGFAVANGFDWSFVQTVKVGKTGIAPQNPVLSIAFYLLVLVITYLLPSEWKHRLIYVRWHHPLPGCRVFTELIDRDSRIARDELSRQYGALPHDSGEQNALWYRIYKKKQSDKVVCNSHGRWLLFRDLFSIAIVLLIPSCAFTFWYSDAEIGMLFSLVNVALVAVLWVCARNTGERFACNVLAR